MKTREALIERYERQHELLMQGKIKRIEAESDVLHSGVGSLELKVYEELFERAKGVFDNKEKSQRFD